MESGKLFNKLMGELKRSGILMVVDPVLPSVATIVAREPIRGSWWAHPKSHDIFAMNVRLSDHPDVLVTKLVAGKTTFVHRKIWLPLIEVASAREPWQMNGLSDTARKLLSEVIRCGQSRIDHLVPAWKIDSKAISNAAKELESRLLVRSDQVHTEKGAHSKELESWQHWVDRVELTIKPVPADDAKRNLERILERLSPGSA